MGTPTELMGTAAQNQDGSDNETHEPAARERVDSIVSMMFDIELIVLLCANDKSTRNLNHFPTVGLCGVDDYARFTRITPNRLLSNSVV
jgi:hypothetical protein